jgi:hypothetical protein
MDLTNKVSSIVFKKRTTKKFHRIEELIFKHTESVCDENSEEEFSELVS